MEEKPASYERVVYKNPSEYHYMKIHLVLEKANKSIGAEEFKQLIISGLKDLYGEVGAAMPFDVLTFDQTALSAILRVYNSGLVKLWSSLTLIGSYANESCAFRVTQIVNNLRRVLMLCSEPSSLYNPQFQASLDHWGDFLENSVAVFISAVWKQSRDEVAVAASPSPSSRAPQSTCENGLRSEERPSG